MSEASTKTSSEGPQRFAGKVALVTGAASGIGKATAKLLAAEGAATVLADVAADPLKVVERELTSAGLRVSSVTGDVADDEDARRMVEESVRRHGRLDVVVPSAGVFAFADTLSTSVDEWDRQFRVNGRGVFLIAKHAIQAMHDAGRGGSLVLISSISGVAGQANVVAYGASKFVVSGLVKHLAIEWAAHHIRVNGVVPGTTLTDAVRAQPPEVTARLTAAHPIGRLAEPEEIAKAIVFLASDDASFTTGALLCVDGGFLAQ